MGSPSVSVVAEKPHALCIPLPFQGHINGMLKLAKVLHSKGFHITFVNTEFNHQRLLVSKGPDLLKGLPDFRFETIPDGLPPADINVTRDSFAVLDSFTSNGLVQIRNLIAKLNLSPVDSYVSCIVIDAAAPFTLDAAEELGIPQILLWPMSASVLMTYLHHQLIVEKALPPLKDKSYLTNGYLDKPVDFINGLTDTRLRDLSSFFYDGNDDTQNIFCREITKAPKASAILINTFDTLETDVLDAMKFLQIPAVYPVGPLQLLEEQIPNKELRNFQFHVMKEHTECLEWLDSKQPNSVVYVSFGSLSLLTRDQLIELAWGLANSKHLFLWVIRPDHVMEEVALLPPEFMEETADRCMITGWCPQEKVLCHSSTGGFLTHSGWNSTLDTMCGGVPIISLPFFGDQMTNCRNACVHWGTGMEIDKNVRRDEVEAMVRELMEGEKGKRMRTKAMDWKKSAEESAKPGGSSYVNIDKVVEDVLLRKKLEC